MKQSVANLPVEAIAPIAIAGKLRAQGFVRIFDVALHLPIAYEDHSRITPICQAMASGLPCVVAGKVVRVSASRRTVIQIDDGQHSLDLVFFNISPFLAKKFVLGAPILAFGVVKHTDFGVQMQHPQILSKLGDGLNAIYPAHKLHQNQWRTLIRQSLDALQAELQQDAYTQYASACGVSHETWGLWQSLCAVHLPQSHATLETQLMLVDALKTRTHGAYHYLAFEEALAHALRLRVQKLRRAQTKAPSCPANSPLAQKLLANLPFTPTGAQTRVMGEIAHDMAQGTPMLRLVQGDVGAGKTLVAAISACHALDGGWQVAVLAPTEVLAEQHLTSFDKWFAPLGVTVVGLFGKDNVKQKREKNAQISQGVAQIVVGTHAILQKNVEFYRLGLIIVDEQHRFGVAQRLSMVDKGASTLITAHQLSMTATPIPRTLAMSKFGDMDTSVLDEMPKGRLPIVTVTINNDRRKEVIDRVAAVCREGRQAYWVCVLVGESESIDAKAAQTLFAELAQIGVPVGLVHGKMKAQEKSAVMADFKSGKLSLLVATTVIEVGVDVPNASIMVIENAERLGLSQLHQLRGRVGRGDMQSYCVLLYQNPLSDTGKMRLNTMRQSNDGFFIAEQDLKIRGAGELFGVRQAGQMGYYVYEPEKDKVFGKMAHDIAPTLSKELSAQIIMRWLGDNDYVNA